jgi:hypothetical protein
VTELDIEFYNSWPQLSLQVLSVFIDISRIVTIRMSSDDFYLNNENTWMDIGIFMEQAHSLY